MPPDVAARALGSILPESLNPFRTSAADGPCDCVFEFDDGRLVVDASACSGELAESPTCRRAVVEALAERDAESVVVHAAGLERRYDGEGARILAAAGRFVELVASRDRPLARAVARDPIGEGRRLRNRLDEVGDAAVEAGLLDAVDGAGGYAEVFRPRIGFEIAHYHVDPSIPDGARLVDVRDLEGGGLARVYRREDRCPLYVPELADLSLSPADRRLIVDGYGAIADGRVEGDRAPSRAIERVVDGPVDPTLAAVLEKHTEGYGVLEDLFADHGVTDVYVTSPVSENPLRVDVDGTAMETTVHLTATGAKALASRIRRTSGRAFSRAEPTIAATASLSNGRRLRVAGVTEPVADGTAFALRERSEDRFTLPALVANGTMSAAAAGFLSTAVERNAAALIAGTRGAGKTTLLGAFSTRSTPERGR